MVWCGSDGIGGVLGVFSSIRWIWWLVMGWVVEAFGWSKFKVSGLTVLFAGSTSSWVGFCGQWRDGDIWRILAVPRFWLGFGGIL